MSEAVFVPLVETAHEPHDAFVTWTEPFATAKVAPVDEYQRGMADGQALAATAFTEERERFQKLVAAANALQPIEPAALRQLIHTTVERLVREIVGATPVDREMLSRGIDEALHFAGAVGKDALLRLSPDDAALLADAKLPLQMVSDAQLTPGTLQLETDAGTIEHGRAVQLEALRIQLGIAEDDR